MLAADDCFWVPADPRAFATPRRGAQEGGSPSVDTLVDDQALNREQIQNVVLDFFVDLIGDYDEHVIRTRVVNVGPSIGHAADASASAPFSGATPKRSAVVWSR